jgi:hypothetical protein
MNTLSSAGMANYFLKFVIIPENFPAGQFLRKADKCIGVCIVNWDMTTYSAPMSV